MKYLTPLSFAVSALLFLTIPSAAQPGKVEIFTSIDGRFTIALPEKPISYAHITPERYTNEFGGEYTWQLKDATISVKFAQMDQEGYFSELAYPNLLQEFKERVLKGLKAKEISEKSFELGRYRARTFDFESSTIQGQGRVFMKGVRYYVLTGTTGKGTPGTLDLIAKIFDTFTVTKAQPRLSDELRKKIDATEAAVLPQETVAKKERSDAYDDNLKGPVKTVTEESESLSGLGVDYEKSIDSITEFNKRGDKIKEIEFSGNGIPRDVVSYGYIDGVRAQKSTPVNFTNRNLFTVVGKNDPVSPKAPDPRYDVKFIYKYVNGKISELQTIGNNGIRGTRRVFSYNENVREDLTYDGNDIPNQKSHYLLDEKGNEIERISFEVRPNQPKRDAQRYPVKYNSYDEMGNWTERTTYEIVIENGKQTERPMYKEFRTITYYL